MFNICLVSKEPVQNHEVEGTEKIIVHIRTTKAVKGTILDADVSAIINKNGTIIDHAHICNMAVNERLRREIMYELQAFLDNLPQ